MILFVLGLEGCGHHGLKSVCSNIFRKEVQNSSDFLDRRLQNIIIHNWRKYRELNLSRLVEVDIPYYLEKTPPNTSYIDFSYPFGNERIVDRYCRLLDLYNVLHQIDIDVRVLHLKRNIFNTINSHSDWDGGIIGHASKTCSFHNYLAAEIAALRSNNISVYELSYEHIETKQGVKLISEFLSVSSNIVEKYIKKCFRMSQKDYKQILSNDIISQITTIINEHNILIE
jgi:hypothetical protein